MSSKRNSYEFKLVPVKRSGHPARLMQCLNAKQAASYWRKQVETSPSFSPVVEYGVVLFLDAHHQVRGHQVVAMGATNAVALTIREIFRGAIVAGSAAIYFMHNHPSGIPEPSEADISVTQEIISAGKVVGIDLFDHVIIGGDQHVSLMERGDIDFDDPDSHLIRVPTKIEKLPSVARDGNTSA